MGSTDNFFSGIDKVLDIVDEAISTNNYSNMANQIQKSVKPYSKKQLSEEERARLMRELEKWNARSKADTGRNLYKEGAGRTYNGGHMEGRGNAFYGSYDPGTGQAGTRSAGVNAVAPVEDEYFLPAESTIGNNVMFGLGAAGTVMAGLPSIGMLTFTLMSSGSVQTGGAILTSMMLAITAGFGALTYFGKRGANKKKRHFDEQEKTFIADDKIYQQYLDTQANAAVVRREAEQRAKEENVISPEVRDVLDRGNEYIAEIRKVWDEAGISWQTAELGRVNRGGGGTIAAVMAELGMDVVDMGVPVWSMHAPVEVISKIDLYYLYLGYKAFIENIG